MNIRLHEKIALVTASSKGIGLGVAKALHRAGAKVALCSRDRQHLAAAVKEMGENGSERVFAKDGDVSDPTFLTGLVDDTERAFSGSIDILVNNSGGPPAGDTLGFSDDQWKEALSSNLLSVVRLSRLVVPGMKAKNWGRIVNLTSMTAREPDPGLVLSNVTRAGVSAFAKTLAHEVGPFGITVNTILTGGVLTDRLRSLVQQSIAGTDKTLESAIAEIAQGIPVRRIASPDEFARLILFVVSDEAGYLNGVAIPLDGGASRSI